MREDEVLSVLMHNVRSSEHNKLPPLQGIVDFESSSVRFCAWSLSLEAYSCEYVPVLSAAAFYVTARTACTPLGNG